jgi:hypothetical protein
MKHSYIDKLDLPEAKRILKKVFDSPLLNVYISMKKQVDDITSQIENTPIVFGQDSDEFNEFIKWGDKVQKLTDLIYDLEKKIDPTELARAKRARLKPSELKPEFYAQQRKDK